MKTIITKLKNYITDSLDARIDKLVSREIRERLDDIDLDRQVANSIKGIDWSDHLDYSDLAYHLEIDYTDLVRYIDIDTSDLADELTQRLEFSVRTKQ